MTGNVLLVLWYGMVQSIRYQYFSNPRSWNRARDKCRERGGELARVRGDQGQEYLTDLIQAAPGRTPYYVWLGAQDRQVDGEWLWITDRVDLGDDYSGFTKWCGWIPFFGSSPNGFAIENCLAMDMTDECWDDQACFYSNPYICEFEEDEEEEDPLAIAISFCAGVLDEETVRNIWNNDRTAYENEEGGFENRVQAGTCAYVALENEVEYINCCCAADDSACTPNEPEDEETQDVFVTRDGESCLYLPQLLEANEVCLDSTGTMDAASCWSACEDSYAFPLAAAYLNENQKCCCASSCLCTNTDTDGFLALARDNSQAEGVFNQESQVATCSELEEELENILGDNPGSNIIDLLDNALSDVDDLPMGCAANACLSLGQPDASCCSPRNDVGCANGYVLNTGLDLMLCGLSLDGSSSRFLTCCVEEDVPDEEEADADSLVMTIGDSEVHSPEEYCADLELIPASIRDADEENLILEAMAERRIDTVWLGAELRERRWVWMDGSSTAYLETRAPQIVIDPNSLTRLQLTIQGEWIVVIGDTATAIPICRAAVVNVPETRSSSKKSKSKQSGAGLLVVLIIIAILLSCILCLGCFFLFKKNQQGPIYRFAPSMHGNDIIIPDSVELMPSKLAEAPL
eukprot:CAMPEP_0197285016 /NCGR_PEP_ID=MMETSP0890-20130614/123_1 /TAXON_ID=44058 ORGANISM="Aureoumbra lagunensis, Strain CCMP1510" /NCGR_SAMPLE_ID=MMETSP0890 /ASSEMBLY_ACC=CAM_ASM_000533 /LENGTH=632 /DNA_ID=CAMNT_0042752119 /DNA_START=121 /DNA_END=2019 /DNA_ORIENTATION=+